ncbi:MarR family winged helix-turn-helix transcriptional regulator [Bradyrhizobium elkanii]|jgi:DNA-binding MarR family transcriptional regulator|uniref:MarR family winged helix-turn-helix transcriptional regulator n=1 Tax=Bradyrhizobium elkanii TaxID=29448 RepID=UPI001FCD620A|nr:MarR family winged helix-turn-helix transcriptional regulator [Bradyrhizobium elkanii]
MIFVDNPTPFAIRVSVLTNRYVTPLASFLDKEYGLQWHEWVVVFCIELRDGWTATDISNATGRPKNTISRAVHKLLKMGLITRRSRDDDARVQVLALTAKGKRFYTKVLPRLQVVERSIYDRLNKKEQAQFIKLLDKLHGVGS